jgi:hypothetical protein
MPAYAGIHGFFFVATSEVVDAGPSPGVTWGDAGGSILRIPGIMCDAW